MTPYYTFENILALEYAVPDYVPHRAKDLIEKLLRLEPEERLGAGSFFGDRENSMDALKAHPFFEGINFGTLSREISPINNSSVVLSP
jgi:3-phosphoinositide dependent protein kinase-1